MLQPPPIPEPEQQKRLARPKRLRARKRPLLNIGQILQWADAFEAAHGRYPKKYDGPIHGTIDEKWAAVDSALHSGNRGLQRGSSLARLFAENRGYRNDKALPPFTIKQILRWVDAFRATHGRFPKSDDGQISEADVTWNAIDAALRAGCRGWPGGSSLPRLLAERRGHRNRKGLPPYTEEQILEWVDAFNERNGRWPRASDGTIAEAPGETWRAVDMALGKGLRGLPGRSTLAKLLNDRRGVRHRMQLPPFTVAKVLRWAKAHHARTGQWPMDASGPIAEAPGETWMAVSQALVRGRRGFSGGSSLTRLLAQKFGLRNLASLPPLTVESILAWADAHRQRSGKWPTCNSGPIPEAKGETWMSVDTALNKARRGLERGSLAMLLEAERGRRHYHHAPSLTVELIQSWAKRHFELLGSWPNVNSGSVIAAEGESWRNLDGYLRRGKRRLPGGTSLHRIVTAAQNQEA